MTRTEIERTALPTVLDRLTDLAPGTPGERAPSREASVREYRLSVQRDVEDLLNTRRSIRPVDPSFVELHDSVFLYGLPDTTGIAIRTPQGRQALLDSIRDTLERFEPRLAHPVVRMATEETERGLPSVRFTVEALLRMSPSPEQVVFDTLLEIASGTYEVRDSSAGAAGGSAHSATR